MSHHDDFRHGAPDHIARAKAFLSSAAAADTDARAFFLARARGAFELAKSELATFEILLAAREKEIARTAGCDR